MKSDTERSEGSLVVSWRDHRGLAQHHQPCEIGPQGTNYMMADRFRHIPPDKWDEAADRVIKEIRAETGVVDWLPTFLNGRREFERRVLVTSMHVSRQCTSLRFFGRRLPSGDA